MSLFDNIVPAAAVFGRPDQVELGVAGVEKEEKGERERERGLPHKKIDAGDKWAANRKFPYFVRPFVRSSSLFKIEEGLKQALFLALSSLFISAGAAARLPDCKI